VRHKFSATENVKTRFIHAELYKIILEDSIECDFPNVDIDFRIILTFMVTNCSAECSFSRLKYIKIPLRTTMQQGRLDALSLLCIEADELCKIGYEDLIKGFTMKKVGENCSTINKMEPYRNKYYFPSYCKFCLIYKCIGASIVFIA